MGIQRAAMSDCDFFLKEQIRKTGRTIKVHCFKIITAASENLKKNFSY